MNLYIDPIEGLWLFVTAGGAVLTSLAFLDARRDLTAAKLLDGDALLAQMIVAKANVRREGLRTIVQLLLLSIVIPSLFVDRPISLSPILVALILVPIILLTSTTLDRRDRGRLLTILSRAPTATRKEASPESADRPSRP